MQTQRQAVAQLVSAPLAPCPRAQICAAVPAATASRLVGMASLALQQGPARRTRQLVRISTILAAAATAAAASPGAGMRTAAVGVARVTTAAGVAAAAATAEVMRRMEMVVAGMTLLPAPPHPRMTPQALQQASAHPVTALSCPLWLALVQHPLQLPQQRQGLQSAWAAVQVTL